MYVYVHSFLDLAHNHHHIILIPQFRSVDCMQQPPSRPVKGTTEGMPTDVVLVLEEHDDEDGKTVMRTYKEENVDQDKIGGDVIDRLARESFVVGRGQEEAVGGWILAWCDRAAEA